MIISDVTQNDILDIPIQPFNFDHANLLVEPDPQPTTTIPPLPSDLVIQPLEISLKQVKQTLSWEPHIEINSVQVEKLSTKRPKKQPSPLKFPKKTF